MARMERGILQTMCFSRESMEGKLQIQPLVARSVTFSDAMHDGDWGECFTICSVELHAAVDEGVESTPHE
jgi:hypothetical protein